jgi:signal transduction histidine kinase
MDISHDVGRVLHADEDYRWFLRTDAARRAGVRPGRKVSGSTPRFDWSDRPVVMSYGVAVLSVTAALIGAQRLQVSFETAPVSLFLCAVMLSAWSGGVGPGLLATALSVLAFDYYFVPTIGAWAVEISQIPRVLIFALSALFALSLSAAQRRAAESLGRARDRLDGTVQELERINEALQEENSERQRAQEERQDSLNQLRALAGRLQTVREDERTRAARDIHDDLGQALTALKLEFTALLRDLPSDERPARRRAQSISTLLDATIQSTRRIATELRPGILDDLGLADAVEWVAEEFQARTGTRVQVCLSGVDAAMDGERATALFRILQETLTNVARHANATHVDVRLTQGNGILTLEVHDNGRGITREQLSGRSALGLLGMRERAVLLGGELIITGAPGLGTTVRVRIPLTPPQPRDDARLPA